MWIPRGCGPCHAVWDVVCGLWNLSVVRYVGTFWWVNGLSDEATGNMTGGGVAWRGNGIVILVHHSIILWFYGWTGGMGWRGCQSGGLTNEMVEQCLLGWRGCKSGGRMDGWTGCLVVWRIGCRDKLVFCFYLLQLKSDIFLIIPS